MTATLKEGSWRRPARLLCVAAVLHVALSFALEEVGRRRLFPVMFDRYGDAVAFAPDAECFREDAAVLAGFISAGNFRYWIGSDYQLHTKLYALCFVICGRLLGTGIVGAEPINLSLYLASLVLVFLIGREVFDRRAGLAAAAVVALWPSLLLHSTQFVHDSLFLVLTLGIILIVVRWATRNYSWAAGLMMGAAGALLVTACWLARAGSGLLLVATVLLGALALVVRLLRERRLCAPNLVAATMVVAATVGVPLAMPNAIRLGTYHDPLKPPDKHKTHHVMLAEGEQSPLVARAVERVRKLRNGFADTYSYSGSNVDAEANMDDPSDLLRYLPRAAEIGFFAPFPNMWLAPGKQVGLAGRLVAGVESLAMYAVEALALVGLWRGRKSASAWFLFAAATTCITGLGLVVINIGALYRMRYLFLVLLIVLAAGGAARVSERVNRTKEIGVAA